MKTIITSVLLSLLAVFASAAPEKALDPYWVDYDARSALQVDHSQWQAFLDEYLITDDLGQTLFDYKKVNEDYSIKLSQYINSLAAMDPRSLNRLEQKAYWINLYNALTVQLILHNYPVKSITKIGKKFFSFGPWDDPITVINGRQLTLNQIEHNILRPIYNDPRMHYALNCASLGCPNLNRVAYTADNVDELLEAGAFAFISHERAVGFSGKKLVLSSIYDWYQVDFGGSEHAVVEHIKKYSNATLTTRLDSFNGKISYDYDWALNEVK